MGRQSGKTALLERLEEQEQPDALVAAVYSVALDRGKDPLEVLANYFRWSDLADAAA